MLIEPSSVASKCQGSHKCRKVNPRKAWSWQSTTLISSSVFASTGGMVAPFIAQTSAIHPTVPIAVFGVVSVIAGTVTKII